MRARRVPTISPALLRSRDDQTESDMAQSMGTLAVAVQLMDLPLNLLVHIGKQMDARGCALRTAPRAVRYARRSRRARLEDIHIALHARATAATPGSRWARMLKTLDAAGLV